jgi:hypothetical protein
VSELLSTTFRTSCPALLLCSTTPILESELATVVPPTDVL